MTLVFLFLFTPGAFSQAQQYKFRRLTTTQGVGSNNIYSIVKDPQGFMWFSSGIGLFRYDGYEIKVFRNDPNVLSTLSGNLITGHLFVDTSGIIWVGTKKNGLNLLNTKTDSIIQFIHRADRVKSISSNDVHRVVQDNMGTIWIATLGGGLNKFIPADHSFIHFLPDPNSSDSKANHIYSIVAYDEGKLMVGTGKGLFVFDKERKEFGTWKNHQKVSDYLNQDIVVDIIAADSIYWIATENGLVRYDPRSKVFTRFLSIVNDVSTLSSNTIRHMIESGDKKHLWISTVWGLNRFDTQTAVARRFLYDKNDPFSLGYNMLWNLYLDDNNLLWIATDNAGVNILNLNENPISHHKIGGETAEAGQYTATTFCEDKDRNVWVGTFDGGLWKFDQNMKPVDRFLYNRNSLNAPSVSSIFSLFIDSGNILWVGTSNGDLYKFNAEKSSRIHFTQEEIQNSKPSVIEIREDKQGEIWIGTIAGLYHYNKTSGRIMSVDTEPLKSSLIRSICEDRNGTLWIGTHGEGVFKLKTDDRNSFRFQNYLNDPGNPASISSNTVMSVYEDCNGTIWAATIMGLNRYIPGQDNFKSYGTQNGLKADYLYYIQGDEKGVLWISCPDGLIRFDPTTATSKLYEFQGNNSVEDIYPYTFYLTKNGKIWIGGNHGNSRGYYILNTNSLQDNRNIPPVVFTNFKVRNEVYKTDSVISAMKILKLKYSQNFFSFEFAALDYTNPEKNQYAYMLEGLQEEWTYCGNRRFADFTGLSPGEYKFRVKGSNNDGYWNEEGAAMMIHVLPPPWKTWWAYSLYIIVLIGLISAWRSYTINRLKLKQALEIEHIKAEKLKEMDRVKSRFFANISHEFRTPLTLILGPLEKLKSKTSDPECHYNLSIIQRNARNLQNLINQLLGISKLESGQMKLHTKQENIIPLVKGYLQSFESYARQKNIILSFSATAPGIMVSFDPEKLEKILYNLLSNAFKFTGEGGEILVAIGISTLAVPGLIPPVKVKPPIVNRQLSYVTITVSDTGQGILPEKLPHIFDRFYQVDDSYIKDQEGTGIGLAITKELVVLHHGQISVESQPGKGTTFTVFLPLGKDHLKPEEVSETDEEVKPEEFHQQAGYMTEPSFPKEPSGDEDETEDSKPLLLLVEDHDDLRAYIRSYLVPGYRIIEATDGVAGLQMAISKIPDLIVSDVLMPKLDGIELCGKLKTDERTSHIPIILLTARASMEDKIEGLETGADDFLTKPFNPDELMVRIRNLILGRKKLRERLLQEAGLQGLAGREKATDNQLFSIDQKFLIRARAIAEQHMADETFNISQFSEKMHLSRTQLHRKLRALVDQSATEFIRSIRINHAVTLLGKHTGNISEIALEVGFQNPAYFAECFRKQTGMLPTEFVRKQKKK